MCTNRIDKKRRLLPFALALLLGVAQFASAQGRAQASAAGTGTHEATVQAPPGGNYVGSDTCVTCHDEPASRFNNTVMGKIFADPRAPQERLGCEACHGPGKGHVDAGGGKDTIPVRFAKDANETAEDRNAACLACHEKGQRMFWQGSPHESRGLACVDCHQIMTEKKVSIAGEARFNSPLTDVKSVKASQPELCLRCHPMRRAQLQRSSHMPFREGKVTCTSCHNPHGTPNPKQLIHTTVNETCYSCHAERRGPFLWEHPPAVENCANCHEPHGSTNPQLLKIRTPKLCQQCHNDGQHRTTAYANVMPSAGIGTPAGFNNRVVNRGCNNCHSRIHGSNHPSGNYFTR